MRQRVQKTFCTTREAAQMLGVSLRTAQLWAERGLLEAWKTEGGHRRISRESVERLLADPGSRVQETPVSPGPLAVATPERWRSDEPPPRSGTLSILVAEDEATLRRIYELNLARWPMRPEVRTAADGYEALILMGHAKPDLLITDLRMPGMDGYRMIDAIRRTPELAGVTIVVVTGLSPEEIDDGNGALGGIAVLPKPIPFAELQEIAERIQSHRTGAAPLALPPRRSPQEMNEESAT